MKAALFLLQLFLLLVSVECDYYRKSKEKHKMEVTHSAFACQDMTIALECPQGSTLRILRANYGRSNNETCDPDAFGISSINEMCVTNDSDPQVKTQCDNQTMCQFAVTNDLFGDTCVGTFKFLEVDFACDKQDNGVEFQTRYACEDSRLLLECPKGKVINVTRANYGRDSNITCDPVLLMRSGNMDPCGDDEATSLVETSCNGQKQCQILTSNSVFGDPCPGTSKFLEVDFQCQSTETDDDDHDHDHVKYHDKHHDRKGSCADGYHMCNYNCCYSYSSNS